MCAEDIYITAPSRGAHAYNFAKIWHNTLQKNNPHVHQQLADYGH